MSRNNIVSASHRSFYDKNNLFVVSKQLGIPMNLN